jgi:hypothetical protein
VLVLDMAVLAEYAQLARWGEGDGGEPGGDPQRVVSSMITRVHGRTSTRPRPPGALQLEAQRAGVTAGRTHVSMRRARRDAPPRHGAASSHS